MEENSQLHGLTKKATEKSFNQISTFEELECEKSFKHKSEKIKRKLWFFKERSWGIQTKKWKLKLWKQETRI